MENRFIALEEKFVFLEQHLEELDVVVREAFESIEAMRREIAGLQGYIEKVEQQQLEEEPGEEDPGTSSLS